MKQINNYSGIDDKFELKADIFNSLNCHRIGIIQSFNSTNQTAKIKLVDKRILAGYEGTQAKEFSLLIDVPIFIVSGGGAWLNQPIQAGDECLVLFNDRNIDRWFSSGNIQPPENSRAHSLQDGLAIVGFHSQLKKLTNFSTANFGLNFQNAKLQIDNTGKIDISNQAKDLKTLIANLINILQNLKTVNGATQYPIDSTTNTNLSTLLTDFQSLLK
mgnify:FL=1